MESMLLLLTQALLNKLKKNCHDVLHCGRSHLAFDEPSHGPLAQLRRGALRDAERGGDHLAAGAVHADEVDETGEILQEREIS